MTRNRRVGGVSMYQRSLFGRKAKAQVDLGAHRRGIEKRLRRSHIFIARETRKAISSVGATSNQRTTFYAAPSGAGRLLCYRCYKDFAPTELGIPPR
jgi:hypothetical protein